MLQLPGGIERIDIDDDQAGAKNATQRHRILQYVGQHDGNTLALHQPELILQVARKAHG